MAEKKQRKFSQINSGFLKSFSFRNFNNIKQTAHACPLSSRLIITTRNIRDIIDGCNQEAVYKFLFKEKLRGREYNEDDARSFISWANNGWKEKSYFVFVIKTKDNKIIGALDIKSNKLESAEIGYWANSDYSGYMTNAVIRLIKRAKLAGYKSLVAFTKPRNHKSKRLLIRAGFDCVGKGDKKPNLKMDKFIFKLK